MPRPSASPAPTSEIVVYENGGDLRLDVRTDGETVWLTQEQMCRLFGPKPKTKIGFAQARR